MSGITKSDLVRFANSPDAELRLRKDADNVIGTQEATWHGRVARFLKVTFGGESSSTSRSVRREEYADVEKAVYGALKSEYSEDVAKSVFRKVVGHDASVERTHSDYPITSRQVREMVKLAEREIDREAVLTIADLEALALTGDSELRGSPEGGLIARKGNERTVDELNYSSGKHAVLRALTETYGSDVAEHAFAHGAGRLNAKGEIESPRDEPLRGSQIRKMLEYAEVLVSRFETRNLQVREPGQRDLATRDLPNVIDARVTDAATLEWIRCIQDEVDTPEARQWQGERGTLHDIQGNQYSHHGDIKSSKFNETYRNKPFASESPPVAMVRGQPIRFAEVSQMTKGLMDDLEKRPKEDVENRHFWVLDLGLTKPFRDGGLRQRIAIHVDQKDPDTIHVFDANRREARVPRGMFDSWLAAHLTEVYGDDIKHLSLHRMEPKYLGLYDEKGNTYQCDKTMELADHEAYEAEFIRQLEGGITVAAEQMTDYGGGVILASRFGNDLERCDTRIITDDGLVSLTNQNAPSTLKELVRSENDESDKLATKQLSILLTQAPLNAVGDMVNSCGVGVGNVLSRNNEQGSRQIEARRLEDENGRPVIDITYRDRASIELLDIENQDIYLDRNKNGLRSEVTLRIAVDDLREEDGYQNYTIIQPPRCSLHLESKALDGEIEQVVDQPDWQTHMAFSAHGDWMIAQPPDKRLSTIEQYCRPGVRDAEVGAPPQGLGLSDVASLQLSKLTRSETFLPLYQAIGQDVTGRIVQPPPPDQVNVTSKLSKDGTAVDVEFRYPMPDGFPGDNTTFHSFGVDAPHGDGRFELTLRVRIPVEELQNGHPENFVLMGGPYTQQHGLSFGPGIGADVNKGATYDWMRRVDAGKGSLTGTEWRADRERLLRITVEGQGADEAFGDMQFVAQTQPLVQGKDVPEVAAGLLDDALRRFDDDPWSNTAFWALDLKLTEDFRGGGDSQTIGIHVDRNDPGMIHVFDASHSETRVPRDGFSDWLNAHLATVYGDNIEQLSVHRVEQKGFKNDVTKLLHEVSQDMLQQPDGTQLASVFLQDANRNETIIVTEGQIPLKLTHQNAVPLLTGLVSTGDEDLDRIAAGQLSIFLGQSVLSTMDRDFMATAAGDGSMLMSNGKGEVTDMEVRRVEDKTKGPMIDITYRGVKNLVYADLPGRGQIGLDPRTDSLKFECTIRIPIESLQVEGGYRECEILRRPQCRLHLPTLEQDSPQRKWYDEDLKAFSHITFCQYGDRMIASAGLGEIWETTDECRSHIPDVGNQLGRLPPDELLLSQNESGQLARLMDPQIFAPIYLGVANVEVPDDDTIGVTVVRSLAQGKPMIDVEYRYPMPETFPDETTTLRYWGDEPRGDARFDMTMRIRIPVEELENGRPESFVVIGGPHIERQKLN